MVGPLLLVCPAGTQRSCTRARCSAVAAPCYLYGHNSWRSGLPLSLRRASLPVISACSRCSADHLARSAGNTISTDPGRPDSAACVAPRCLRCLLPCFDCWCCLPAGASQYAAAERAPSTHHSPSPCRSACDYECHHITDRDHDPLDPQASCSSGTCELRCETRTHWHRARPPTRLPTRRAQSEAGSDGRP